MASKLLFQFGDCTGGNWRAVTLSNRLGTVSRLPLDPSVTLSKYDGLLQINPTPGIPNDRFILLHDYETSLIELDTNNVVPIYPRRFKRYPCPVWQCEATLADRQNLTLLKDIVLFPYEQSVAVFWRIVLPYNYKATGVRLKIRPWIENRICHAVVRPGSTAQCESPAKELSMLLTNAKWHEEPANRILRYACDMERELEENCESQVHSPGWFECEFTQRGSAPGYVVLFASVEKKYQNEVWKQKPIRIVRVANAVWRKKVRSFTKLRDRKQLYVRDNPNALVLALNLDSFIVHRKDRPTTIAGYPWFLDWGRDTLICIPGLIAGARAKEAKTIVLGFARYEEHGTLPNVLRGEEVRNRDTSDAPLWFVEACRILTRNGKSGSLLRCRVSDAAGRTVRDVLESIVSWYIRGTPNGIGMDTDSGLIWSPAHFTWMDTNNPPCTPREGYPVEIQALWYNALTFVSTISNEPGNEHYEKLARRVRDNFTAFYPNKSGYLNDCLSVPVGTPARNAVADPVLRPNQLFAIRFGLVKAETAKSILRIIEEKLLVPLGVRSLADERLAVPLSIKWNGLEIGDPYYRYHGKYIGPEGPRENGPWRKIAYHNGTAWTWLFFEFLLAYLKVYGKTPATLARIREFLRPLEPHLSDAGVGSISELLDGDAPHTPRGCDCQAWSVAKALEVLSLL